MGDDYDTPGSPVDSTAPSIGPVDSPDTYAWIDDSVHADALCLTIVPGGNVENVIRAFGADSTAAVAVDSWQDDFWFSGRTFTIRELPEAILVIEPNGYLGNDNAVLAEASRDALAASAY